MLLFPCQQPPDKILPNILAPLDRKTKEPVSHSDHDAAPASYFWPLQVPGVPFPWAQTSALIRTSCTPEPSWVSSVKMMQ